MGGHSGLAEEGSIFPPFPPSIETLHDAAGSERGEPVDICLNRIPAHPRSTRVGSVRSPSYVLSFEDSHSQLV